MQSPLHSTGNFEGRMNHETHSGRNSGRTWPIHDRASLAALVAQAIRERFGNSSRAGARASKLSQALLSRLQRETQNSIEPGTLIKLHDLVGADHEDELRSAILAPGASRLGRAYTGWLQRSMQSASFGLGRWWTFANGRPQEEEMSKDQAGQTQRDCEREELWAYLRAVAPATVNPAEALFLKHPSYPEYRRVMLERILGPLLNYAESAFVEYSWRELSTRQPKTLVRIVELGIRRERLLLRKEDTLERNAQAIADSVAK